MSTPWIEAVQQGLLKRIIPGNLMMDFVAVLKKWAWRIYLFTLLMASMLAGWWIASRLQAGADLDPLTTIVNKIYLVIPLLLSAVLFGVLLFEVRRPRLQPRLVKLLESDRIYWGVLILLLLALIESVQDLLYLQSGLPVAYMPVFIRESRPLLIWTGFASGLSGIFLVSQRFLSSGKRIVCKFSSWFIAAGILIAAFILVIITGTGFIPKSSLIFRSVGYFVTANAPLPMVQVVVAWLAITLGWYFFSWLRSRIKRGPRWLSSEVLSLLALWLLAFLLWSSVPLEANYFLDSPRAPNYQFNVTSDSIYYEIQSHRLLAGEGFVEDIQHPFYAYYTSVLHLIGGDHYQDVYLLQIALLSLTPFLLFKLTALLHNRFSGTLAAVLFIIRERNAILVSDSITVTSVNLLMTETITLLGVILVVYLLLVWIRESKVYRDLPLLIGSLIGLLAMIRVEMLSLALVFGIISLVINWKAWKAWFWKSLLMVSGLLLVILPWMFRNQQVTGRFYLDKGLFFQATFQQYAQQMTPPEEEDIVADTDLEPAASGYSLSRLERIYLHVKNSFSQSLLYLPSNHQPLAGVDNYLKIVPEKGKVVPTDGGIFSDAYLTRYVKILPYWDLNWDGALDARSILPLLLVIALISYSFGIMDSGNWVQFTAPLLALAAHIFTYAVFSRSGGRFVQVVDWIPLVYFSIGLSRFTPLVGGLFLRKVPSSLIESSWSASNEDLPAGGSKQIRKWILPATAAVFLVGLSMPILEMRSVPKYSDQALSRTIAEVPGLEAAIEDFSPAQSEDFMVYGKALYPGFYLAGRGPLDDRSGRLPDASTPRLMFYLVGMENIWVSLPCSESPDYFPHGADVIIQGRLVRDTAEDLSNGFQPYLLAETIYLISEDHSFQVVESDCGIVTCQ